MNEPLKANVFTPCHRQAQDVRSSCRANGRQTPTMTTQLAERLPAALAAICLLPRRMLLDTPGVAATVPMLRGVWGAALHDLDPAAYAAVFGPNDEALRSPGGSLPAGGTPPHRVAARLRPRSATANLATAVAPGPAPPTPTGGTEAAAYILRPAPPDPQFAPAVEWILIGDATQHDFTLCRAWDVASGMGLGPNRLRFQLRRTVVLQPDGRTVDHASPWPLSDARWIAQPRAAQADRGLRDSEESLRELKPHEPCRLAFPAPLRLMFRKRLIEAPTLPDIVVAACRRVKAYLPAGAQAEWDALSRQALDAARATPATPWQGQRLDLHRYSGRQRAELELRGVAGFLELPGGPGELSPLLAAAQWLHLGKGTVMGLGRLIVEQGTTRREE